MRACAAALMGVTCIVSAGAFVSQQPGQSLLDEIDTPWALAVAWVAMSLVLAAVGFARLGRQGALLTGGAYVGSLASLLIAQILQPLPAGILPVAVFLGAVPIAGLLAGLVTRDRIGLLGCACLAVPVWMACVTFLWSQSVWIITDEYTGWAVSWVMTVTLPWSAALATVVVWLTSRVGLSFTHVHGRVGTTR